MTKQRSDATPSGDLVKGPDGHWLFHGARWHIPRQGAPTECEVDGCDRVLGAWRNHDPLAALDESDEPDETGEADRDDGPADPPADRAA